MLELPDLTPEQAEALAKAKIYMDSHMREFVDYDSWYPWQHEIFECKKPQIMVLAGNRCIGQFTPIETADGPAPLSELLSCSSFDVQSWDGESKCVRAASGVFLKGIEPMFRFHLDSGQFFDCSRKHRVLTKYGWLSADRLMWLVSGLHWSQTAADCEASYAEDERRYGQLLRAAVGSDLISLPSIDDVPEPFRVERSFVDEAGQKLPHNQIWQYYDLPSIACDPDRLGGLCAMFADPTQHIAAQSSMYVPLDIRPRRVVSSPDPQSDLVSKIHLIQDVQASDFLVAGNRIVALSYAGLQPVLDFTVEDTATYFAAGVIHHNTGKTRSAGYKVSLNLTGDYPDWWTGYRYEHAPNYMVAGVDNIQLKDVVQKELFGNVVDDPITKKKRFTGGWVHHDEIGRVTWNKQVTDLAVNVEVLGKYGRANCKLRAYTQSKQGQGTLSFAGYSLDGVWIDECPPDDLVGQLVIRLMTGNYNRGGHILYTMTPELGSTQLVTQFMEHRKSSQHLVGPVAWSECPHLTPEVQESILQGVPEDEQEMRAKGVPYFGSGLIYPVPEKRIIHEPFTIDEAPNYFRFLRAIDLGVDHPTAIVWLAYDPEIDCIYLMRDYSQTGESAAYHAAVANSYMAWSPIVFPPDVDTTEKGSGKTTRYWYEKAGIDSALTLDFENPDGSKKVMPGIIELQDRMKTEKFKVLRGCDNFLREKRAYHKKDGKIVKTNDDVMDALRYGAMMLPKYGVPAGGNERLMRKPKYKGSFV